MEKSKRNKKIILCALMLSMLGCLCFIGTQPKTPVRAAASGVTQIYLNPEDFKAEAVDEISCKIWVVGNSISVSGSHGSRAFCEIVVLTPGDYEIKYMLSEASNIMGAVIIQVMHDGLITKGGVIDLKQIGVEQSFSFTVTASGSYKFYLIAAPLSSSKFSYTLEFSQKLTTHTVTFKYLNASGVMISESVQVPHGAKLVDYLPTVPEVPGKVFTGWGIPENFVVTQSLFVTMEYDPPIDEPSPTPPIDDSSPTPTPPVDNPTPTPPSGDDVGGMNDITKLALIAAASLLLLVLVVSIFKQF